MLKPLLPILPTYIWVASKSPRDPSGPRLRTPPERVKVTSVR
jgi:hypothetical protein